jgi:outer membrane protein TolC
MMRTQIATQVGWRPCLLLAIGLFPLGCASFESESPLGLTERRNVPIAVRRFTAEAAAPAKTAPGPQRKSGKNRWRSTQDVQLAGYEATPAPAAEEAAPLPLPTEPGAAPTEAVSETDFLDPRELDLSTALQLVGGQSPQVAFAHQRIEEAAAGVDAASAMWLPSIRAGVSLHRHEGNLQASNGAISDVSRSSLQTGFGANAVGAGTTPTPGLSAQFHFSDAIFAPRIAERTHSARQFGSWVTYHDEMLRAAEAYLELLRAHQEKAIADDTLTQAAALAKQMAAFARTGQGNPADSDRAATELAIRQNDVLRATEAIEVASARLAEVLHLDAPLKVVPTEQQLSPIEMVSLESTVQEMVANGLASRPELGESRELVEAACERLRREQFAPVMPSVLLGLSYGGFGGGLGDRIADVDSRLDFDLGAVWEVRNLGWGESAARDAASARVEQARYQEMRVLDRVAREIIESRAQVRSRQQQIKTARSAIDHARSAYERDRTRINEGQGLPLELLQSLHALDRARREYLNSVASFNTAQFRLHHAIGWPSDGSVE